MDVYAAYTKAVKDVTGTDLTLSEFENSIWGRNWAEAAENMGLSSEVALAIHVRKSAAFSPQPLNVPNGIAELVGVLVGSTNLKVIFCTSGSQSATAKKLELLGLSMVTLKNRLYVFDLQSFEPITVMCHCRKTDIKFWAYLAADKGAGICVDDSLDVCEAAKAAGFTAINWTLV